MICGAFFLIIASVIFSNAQEYYVHPNNNDNNCVSNTSCHTLDYYYQNDYFKSNTTFYFIEGTHVIPSHQTYLFINLTNLMLQGLGRREQGFHETVMESTTVITCESRTSNILFMFSSNITLRSLTIRQCGRPIFYNIQILNYLISLAKYRAGASYFSFDNATVIIAEVHSFSVHEFSALNNSGYGLLAFNAFDLQIYNSSFSQNNLNTFFEGCPLLFCHGANLAILYTNPLECPSRLTVYKVSVVNTNISFGTNLDKPDSIFHLSGGLLVFMEQTAVYGVDLVIDNVVSYGNTALFGANMALTVTATVTYYTVSISRFNSSYGNMVYPLASTGNSYFSYAQYSGFYAIIGAGIGKYPYCTCCGYDRLQYTNVPIKIENSTFLHNQCGNSGAIGIYYLQKSNLLQHVFLKNVHLHSNIGIMGIGLSLFGQIIGIGAPISYIMENVSIENSMQNLLAHYYDDNSTGSALYISSVYNVTINGLTVRDNDASGAIVVNSAVVVTGKNYFINNTGIKGGGISFYGTSFLMPLYPAIIKFIDNHAIKFGGAIFVDRSSQVDNYCLLQITFYPTNLTNDTYGIHCINNTAEISGSVLYGGDIDYCLQLSNSWDYQNSSYQFNLTFQYSLSNDSDVSVIASDALRACFCSHLQPDCNMDTVMINGYPGEIVSIPVVTVGQRFGTTTGTLKVVTVIEGEEIGQTLMSWQQYCQPLSYTVNVKNNANIVANISKLKISIANVPTFSETNITVDITILDCPPGFELLLNSGHCDCSSELLSVLSTTQCNASSQTISKEGNVWMGYNIDKECIIAHKNCPFDYCLLSLVTFNITNPDVQCALNRSGILCGECADGLSLLLGSNKCGSCSNSYFAMLVVFAVVGIALVIFLLLLNFTVSLGMINGLIFFANIIKLNEAIFFPSGPILILSQFISWLNLDLGIETCFYNGMDSYVKVWLQFAFPFYIWAIIIIIIFLAENTKLGRIIGHNTVPVLATLILLSYMKLLRAVTLVLSFAKYKCGQSITHYSWYMDPNIEYLSVKHIILFAFAIGVVFILIIPFTIILLSIQLLEWRVSNFRRCGFLYKMKPFFDAFGGPFKDKYRFWPGLLLVIRLILLLLTSFNNNTSITTATIITCVLFIVTLIANFGGVYQKWYNNLIEALFLGLLSAMSAYADNNTTVTCEVVLSIAFVIFVGVICYHVYLRIENYNKVKKLRNNILYWKQRPPAHSQQEVEALLDDHENEDIRNLFAAHEITEIVARESMIYDDY